MGHDLSAAVGFSPHSLALAASNTASPQRLPVTSPDPHIPCCAACPHGGSQWRDVAVYRLISAGTIEEVVYTRQVSHVSMLYMLGGPNVLHVCECLHVVPYLPWHAPCVLNSLAGRLPQHCTALSHGTALP